MRRWRPTVGRLNGFAPSRVNDTRTRLRTESSYLEDFDVSRQASNDQGQETGVRMRVSRRGASISVFAFALGVTTAAAAQDAQKIY